MLLQFPIPQILSAADSPDRPLPGCPSETNSPRPHQRPIRWLSIPEGPPRPAPAVLPRGPALFPPARAHSCAPTPRQAPFSACPIGGSQTPPALPARPETLTPAAPSPPP